MGMSPALLPPWKKEGKWQFYFAVEIIVSELVPWKTFPGVWLYSKLLKEIRIHLVKGSQEWCHHEPIQGGQQKWQESDGQLFNEGRLGFPHLWAKTGSLTRAGIMGSCSQDSYFVVSSIPVREPLRWLFVWEWILFFLAHHPWWWYQALSDSGAAKCFQHGKPQKWSWSVSTLLKEWQNDFRIKQHLSCLSSKNCWFFFSPTIWCSHTFL